MNTSWTRRPAALIICLGLLLTAALAPAAPASAGRASGHERRATKPRTVLAEYRIPGDPGVELYLRERRRHGQTEFPARKVVLFLEPFGVPTAEAFDVPGYSWMEERALAGFDAWALDVRAFGRSSRPAAMSQPPTTDVPPLTTTADAVRDVDAAVRFIQSRRGKGPIALVGWSWGGVVAGAYAAEHPGRVSKLVLDGAMHAFELPEMTRPLETAPGEPKPMVDYQFAEWEKTTLMHWDAQMRGRPLASAGAIEAVRSVFLAADSTSGQRQPASIRRAMGPMSDLYWIWSDTPVYDAAKITAPVLVISGDSDPFADPTLLRKLVGSPDKREVVIKDATHWALYEAHRDVLLEETAAFLAR